MCQPVGVQFMCIGQYWVHVRKGKVLKCKCCRQNTRWPRHHSHKPTNRQCKSTMTVPISHRKTLTCAVCLNHPMFFCTNPNSPVPASPWLR